jgi:hypothetical protein
VPNVDRRRRSVFCVKLADARAREECRLDRAQKLGAAEVSSRGVESLAPTAQLDERLCLELAL